jgi:DNA-binding transcriptional LysR family regulator
MSKPDYLDLDGRSMRLLVTVLDEGAVTAAAQRLGVSQSAVSHMLDKLRLILDDPLFVRAGRGIAPTPRAVTLVNDIRPLLESMKHLADRPEFDPASRTDEFVIAASGYQRELILPPLIHKIRKLAPGLRLKITDSRFWEVDMFRKGQCDLMITPAAPDGLEFIQRKLFKDNWVCFYDPDSGSPEKLDDYLKRPHAKVVFTSDESSALDKMLESQSLSRHIALRVSSFSALPALMRGSDIVIALPYHIGDTIMRDFAHCPLPVSLPEFSVYLVWHTGQNANPLNEWIRQELVQIVRKLKL